MKDLSMDKYGDLQSALDAARDNLKTLNEKIGRESRDTRKRPHWERDNSNNGQHKAFEEPDKRPGHRGGADGFAAGAFGGGGGKRARNNVFSRLEPRNQGNRGAGGGDHRDSVAAVPQRPRLHSRVTKDIPRREDVVAAQSDEQSRARNKRMFGSLLGTLNKFCQDESRLRGHVEKKAIIEKRVEEQELRERETIKRERRNLFVDRKKKLMEVRLLEIKMERMQDLSQWEENQKRSREYIRTKAGPKIFFLPKVMSETTSKLLQESQKEYDEELAKKREEVQKGIVEVEQRLQRELEKALEEKPAKAHMDSNAPKGGGTRDGRDRNNSLEGEHDDDLREREQHADSHSEGELDEEDAEEEEQDEEEDEDVARPRLVSQVVKSQVEVSIRNPKGKPDRRHVLQSAVNRKMIISVVNNTYEGGGGGGRRF